MTRKLCICLRRQKLGCLESFACRKLGDSVRFLWPGKECFTVIFSRLLSQCRAELPPGRRIQLGYHARGSWLQSVDYWVCYGGCLSKQLSP